MFYAGDILYIVDCLNQSQLSFAITIINMTLPNTLKELQALCEQKSLKYKGKTKAQLKALLANEDDEMIEPAVTDFAVKSVKELKSHIS